jgi:hypothetical protein
MTTRTLTAAGLLILALVSSARSADVLRTLSWSELKASGELTAGEILSPEPPEKGEILKIENPVDKPKQVTLFELKSPGIHAASYALQGRIRYENMKTRGWLPREYSYLEMWSYLSDGNFFFSRTLGTTGPMQRLSGTSGWRGVRLPAFIDYETTARPDRLVVNLVFQGSGTVYLGPLELAEYDSLAQALRTPGAWWDDRTGGWIGGIAGSVIGGLGALIGVLAGCGRARRLVMALTAAMVLLGIASLAAGITALALGQPYGVWYVLVLPGVILVGVCAPLRRTLRRRYDQRELARITAADLGAVAR